MDEQAPQLMAHEDGSYEWLDPSDYRVAEVRLQHDVASVGTVGKRRAADNLLIRGDALHALTSLARLPEFAREYLGEVKLAYDPPFNTGQAFTHYDDALEHSVWLTMISSAPARPLRSLTRWGVAGWILSALLSEYRSSPILKLSSARPAPADEPLPAGAS